MLTYIYKNGELAVETEADSYIKDLGLLRSYAVFDSMRTYNRRPFHLPDHLARLRRSAAALRLEVPCPDEEITTLIEKIAADKSLENPSVRMFVTAGPSRDFMTFTENKFILFGEEVTTFPADLYERGGKLLTCEFQRELPEVKTTNYLNTIRLEPLKRQAGAVEFLYHLNGQVTECPRSSFFIVHQGKLITPKENVLPGITRKIVLGLAGDEFDVEQRMVKLEELQKIDEAFITSTSKGVMPIVQIDGQPIGNGAVGPVTKKVMSLFRAYIENYGKTG